MNAAAVRAPELVPFHVGHPVPKAKPPKPIFLGSGGEASGPTGRVLRIRQSPLTDVGIDWQRHGLEPRWVGMESADCAAALQPSIFGSNGGPELDRKSVV